MVVYVYFLMTTRILLVQSLGEVELTAVNRQSCTLSD